MTYIDAESNKSRITCIMVMAESDWMRIQNLPNRIGCGVKKTRVRTPLVSNPWWSPRHLIEPWMSWTSQIPLPDKYGGIWINTNYWYYIYLTAIEGNEQGTLLLMQAQKENGKLFIAN